MAGKEKAVQTLQPEVAAKYDVAKVSIAKHHFNGFGVIDLPNLTLAQADALAAQDGFIWLVPKGAAPGKTDKVQIPPVK